MTLMILTIYFLGAVWFAEFFWSTCAPSEEKDWWSWTVIWPAVVFLLGSMFIILYLRWYKEGRISRLKTV